MQSQKRNEEIIKKIRFSFVPQIPLATCLPSNVFGRSVPTAVRIMIPGCFTTSTVPVLATLVCKRTQIKPFQVPCVSTKLKNNIQNNSISNLNDKKCSLDHWEKCVLKYRPAAAAIVVCESAFNIAESAGGQLAPTLARRIIFAT